MIDNIYAIYNGRTYECEVESATQIKLYSNQQEDGFKASLIKYVKIVPKSECERIWRQELYFGYMGDRFRVWNQKDNMLYLEADRETFDAEKYGFELVRHGDYGSKIYGKWVSETDGKKEWVITEY